MHLLRIFYNFGVLAHSLMPTFRVNSSISVSKRYPIFFTFLGDFILKLLFSNLPHAP